jgi:hypothetical protein
MAHEGLKRPRIDSTRRQGVSGSVPQSSILFSFTRSARSKK